MSMQSSIIRKEKVMYEILAKSWDEVVNEDLVIETSTAMRMLYTNSKDISRPDKKSELLIFYDRVSGEPYMALDFIKDTEVGIPNIINVSADWQWHLESYSDMYILVLESKQLVNALSK